MRTFIAIAAISFSALVLEARAHACSLLPPETHEIDPVEQGLDVTPPGPPEVLDLGVRRGKGPQPSGCGATATSCDDIGFIDLLIAPGVDDRTPPERMGYRLERVDGTLPDGLQLATLAERARDGLITLTWGDGATNQQEPISFRVLITAVDLAGNESSPTEYAIAHPGSTGGCRTTGTAAGDGAMLGLALAALAFFRRRGR